jgi:tRNA(Ile)-lysidine synthase TilS/MesJ
LGLSGGKDSLSLLHCLLEFKRKLPIRFDLEVCTVDPMTSSFDPSPLVPYVESLGIKYHYLKEEIVDRATEAGKKGKMVTSLCAYCARMKRGLLYSCARNNKCNKLVLAQHLDDCAESVMMSMMHNGLLRTMKANYTIDAGDLSVIRPLVYCRESLMTDFAKKCNLPVINENCPACFEEPKERDRIKKMLSREETLYPNVYDNIRRALMPLMHDDALPILRSITEETLARSRKDVKKTKDASAHTIVDDSTTVANETAVTNLGDLSIGNLLRELARRRGQQKTKTPIDKTDTHLSCSITCGTGNNVLS